MSDLKERYIHAVTKNLPRGSRRDVGLELSTLIDDMLEARCGGEAPSEKDLRVVLTELGTPAELYRKYNPDAGKVLIGAEYFLQYKRVLVIVLSAVLGSMFAVHGIQALFGELSPLLAITEFFAKSFAALLSGFGAVTLVFAILERKGIKVGQPDDTIENLPPVPKKKDKISRADSIVGIALTVVLVVILLCFPQHITVGFDGEGAPAGCYNVFWVQNLLKGKLWLLLFGAAGIVRHVLRLIEGKYTKRLLIASAVCDVLSIVFICMFLLPPELVNPAFLQALDAERAAEGMAEVLYTALANADITLLVILIFATLIDLATDAVRTLRG